ncbi:hypothetical protein BT96DRAFT_920792 [Gymnopus androsaceus JB14]|uniref:RFX-type winged-helix domain-containing protein n=1 Tax=Gymnopus androsaceus JB14 TaxID=1447944 RepID=A0A6A4HM21_9AGAR|nr:hypothetical protein BT96DRAFT_920792 [Gymnopus androsaceus JB14]
MYGNRAAPIPYYRYAPNPPQNVHNYTDDYERSYNETTPNNRMRLSLLSGIDSEITWALHRLFYPGLMDALYEWPEWFSTTGYKEHTDLQSLFAPSTALLHRRQHAISSLFVLRNASIIDDQNALDIVSSKRTLPLLLNALHRLDFSIDANSEFMTYILEIFHAVAPTLILPPKSSPLASSPLKPLLVTMIIAALEALTALFNNQQNASQLSPDSPALSTCLRYLPLFTDKPLLETSLNYLHAHLSYPAMSKAFLLHPEMPSVLRILITLLLVEQVQETVTVDITGVYHTVPSSVLVSKNHELTKSELDSLVATPEPKRCYDWIAAMFVTDPEAEITQVDCWNLYKDAFQPYQDSYALLGAPEVIKNVSMVLSPTQAMVLPGPPMKFIVRGVDRRKDTFLADRLKCQWNRSQCTAPPFSTPVEAIDNIPKDQFRPHVQTHFWTAHISEKHPSQSDTITVSQSSVHPHPNPTRRNPPLPRSTVINFQRAVVDPPSTSLLALLCIRILFRASFESVESAPKVDADHFGFPGVSEEIEEEDGGMQVEGSVDDDKEASRKGRKAFGDVRTLLETVQIKDETLYGVDHRDDHCWMTEIVHSVDHSIR